MNSRPLLVSFVYRVPNSLLEWYNSYESELYMAMKENSYMILMGDFNVDLLAETTDNKKWTNMFRSHGLTQLIKEPTRVTDKTATLLDHVLVSDAEFVQESACISSITMSDHYPVGLTWRMKIRRKCTGHNVISYRKFSKSDYEIMSDNIYSSLDHETFSILDVNEQVNLFTTSVKTELNKCAPATNKRVKRTKQPVWFNQEIKSSINIRNMFKNKGDFSSYKLHRNRTKHLIRKTKKKYYQDMLHSASGNSKKLWKCVRDITGKNSEKANTVIKLVESDMIYTNKQDIANNLNSYFCNAAIRVLSAIDNISIYQPTEEFILFLSSKNIKANSFGIPLITREQVILYLDALDPKKSTGSDNIAARDLKGVSPGIVNVLCNIINTSIVTGKFPCSWKEAKVIPIHKGGSSENMDNYRPISILPIASKLLERHVHSHLYRYFSRNNLLCENQSGFRTNHSCSTCLTNIIEFCYDNINNGNIVGLVALDFRKAFDVINYDILCEKLKMYGCNELTVQWFKSYLKNRTQRVNLPNTLSNSSPINHGVPQGSILGPLLFVIYINDLSLHCHYSFVFKYADDTTVCASGKSVLDIHRSLSYDLLNIEKWCDNNRFAINLNKSSTMVICCSQKRKFLNMDDFKLKMYSRYLSIVSHVKILGLYIDNNLTWRKHVEYICNGVSCLVGLLYRIKNYLNYESKVLFYNSYIISRIDYCLTIWGNAPKDALEPLFRLQKRAARIVLNVPVETSSISCFNSLHWMSIYQRVVYLKCLLMYNIVNNNLYPKYLKCYMKLKPAVHYNLRQDDTLMVPFPHREIFKKSLQFNGVLLWNNLPTELKEAPSYDNFKQKCKVYVRNNVSFY